MQCGAVARAVSVGVSDGGSMTSPSGRFSASVPEFAACRGAASGGVADGFAVAGRTCVDVVVASSVVGDSAGGAHPANAPQQIIAAVTALTSPAFLIASSISPCAMHGSAQAIGPVRAAHEGTP